MREGTGNEELLSNTIFGFEQSTYIRVNLNSKRCRNYCDPNEKDENNFWKIDVEKLNRKMMYANRIKNQGVKARISKELIPIIGFSR